MRNVSQRWRQNERWKDIRADRYKNLDVGRPEQHWVESASSDDNCGVTMAEASPRCFSNRGPISKRTKTAPSLYTEAEKQTHKRESRAPFCVAKKTDTGENGKRVPPNQIQSPVSVLLKGLAGLNGLLLKRLGFRGYQAHSTVSNREGGITLFIFRFGASLRLTYKL